MTSTDGVHLRLFARYARLWAVVTTTLTAAVGTAMIFVGYAIGDDANAETLRAVGQSIIASVIVYVLISLFLDPVRQRLQAQEASAYAIGVANEQFQRRFEASLPVAVFESSEVPKAAFRDAFVKLLQRSRRYDVKGNSAEFTTFRLAHGSHRREFRALEQIRLCLLDPQAGDLLIAQTHLALREAHLPITPAATEHGVAALQLRIYVSLITLFDIRDSLPTQVYFHHDLPLFRCEMFDEGMFLTYYLDSVDYSESLQFHRATRPYRAYAASMDLTRKFAGQVMSFGVTGPSRDLVNTEAEMESWLSALGCGASLSDLRERRNRRFAELRKELRTAGISEQELF